MGGHSIITSGRKRANLTQRLQTLAEKGELVMLRRKTVCSLMLCLSLVVLGSCKEEAEKALLADWNGKWISAAAFIDDPAMQPVFKSVAQAAEGYTAEEVKRLFAAMYRADFGAMEVSDNSITFYEVAGITVKARCEYKAAGTAPFEYEGETYYWHKFELTSQGAACDGYRYVAAFPVHSHEGGSEHWHMRYGADSFDKLLNDSQLAMWWPTLMRPETTAKQVADEMADGPEEMAKMLPPK